MSRPTIANRPQTRRPCEVDEQLPCYVNGSLPAPQLAVIERHVSSCRLCQSSVAELELLAQAVARTGVTPIVPEPDLTGLQRRIDALESRRRWKRPLAHAAGVAFLGVLALLAIETSREGQPVLFETATSIGDTALVDYVVDVRFAGTISDGARIDALDAVVETLSVEAVNETTLRVVVRQPSASLSALGELTRRLAAADGVEAAEIVAVQPHAE